jgi:hypothetical protein
MSPRCLYHLQVVLLPFHFHLLNPYHRRIPLVTHLSPQLDLLLCFLTSILSMDTSVTLKEI